MKTKVIIKQCGTPGRDAQMFRAYEPSRDREGASKLKSLGISASTTGNPEYGAERCAAKALGVYLEENTFSAPIALKLIRPGVWEASLVK